MVVILLREKAKQWSQVTSNLSEDPGWMDIKLLLDQHGRIQEEIYYYSLDSVQENKITACRKIIRENDLTNADWSKYNKAVIAFYRWVFYLVCIYNFDFDNNSSNPQTQLIADIQRALTSLKQ